MIFQVGKAGQKIILENILANHQEQVITAIINCKYTDSLPKRNKKNE